MNRLSSGGGSSCVQDRCFGRRAQEIGGPSLSTWTACRWRVGERRAMPPPKIITKNPLLVHVPFLPIRKLAANWQALKVLAAHVQQTIYLSVAHSTASTAVAPSQTMAPRTRRLLYDVSPKPVTAPPPQPYCVALQSPQPRICQLAISPKCPACVLTFFLTETSGVFGGRCTEGLRPSSPPQRQGGSAR